MDKILYEEIVLLPVAKSDFEKFNTLAEESLFSRHPNRKSDIQEDRQYISELANNMLIKVRKEQEEQILKLHHEEKNIKLVKRKPYETK
jgi:hypothetical protein